MASAKARPSAPAADLEAGPDAMRDLGEALADKDWTAAWTAFQTACGLCDEYEEPSDEE
jgi:hypothetical protein